jgi:hypothetical protein
VRLRAETGVPAALFGGWQISAIVNKSSGFPRDPAVGTDVPNTGAQTYRPNLVSGQDPSLIRNFNLGGLRSLQFRLEAFNLFNNPVWGDPIMSMASLLYGTINTTRTPMRELQIGVKFAF